MWRDQRPWGSSCAFKGVYLTPLAPTPPSKKAPPGGLEPPTHGLEERGQILVGLHGPCLGLCGPALALWGLWALMGLCARNVARGGESWWGWGPPGGQRLGCSKKALGTSCYPLPMRYGMLESAS